MTKNVGSLLRYMSTDCGMISPNTTSSSWGGSLSWEPQVQLITSNDSDANGYSFQRYELPEPAQGGN